MYMYIVCMSCRNLTYPFKPRDRKGSFTTHPNRHCTWCISKLIKNNNIFLTRIMNGSLIFQVKFVGHGVCLILNTLGHFSRFFIVKIYYSKKNISSEIQSTMYHESVNHFGSRSKPTFSGPGLGLDCLQQQPLSVAGNEIHFEYTRLDHSWPGHRTVSRYFFIVYK